VRSQSTAVIEPNTGARIRDLRNKPLVNRPSVLLSRRPSHLRGSVLAGPDFCCGSMAGRSSSAESSSPPATERQFERMRAVKVWGRAGPTAELSRDSRCPNVGRRGTARRSLPGRQG
jgi:hypothetical protein